MKDSLHESPASLALESSTLRVNERLSIRSSHRWGCDHIWKVRIIFGRWGSYLEGVQMPVKADRQNSDERLSHIKYRRKRSRSRKRLSPLWIIKPYATPAFLSSSASGIVPNLFGQDCRLSQTPSVPGEFVCVNAVTKRILEEACLRKAKKKNQKRKGWRHGWTQTRKRMLRWSKSNHHIGYLIKQMLHIATASLTQSDRISWGEVATSPEPWEIQRRDLKW